MKTASPQKITNLQQELLKVFHYELKISQLMEVKDLLASYFAEKASDEMDKIWNSKRWTNKTMEKFSTQRRRSSSK